MGGAGPALREVAETHAPGPAPVTDSRRGGLGHRQDEQPTAVDRTGQPAQVRGDDVAGHGEAAPVAMDPAA
ncbi:hypothetical protein SDC9_162060 [bioreactor metagenome]|uniref:Uncharacterized protein n=1 Tax=bioreactor metagenome TaxID=1076179 RepID=A0A645FRE2_9ZZZZ